MGKSATERSRDLRAKRRAAGVPIKTTARLPAPTRQTEPQLSPLETRVARLEALMSAQEHRLVALEDRLDPMPPPPTTSRPNLQGVAMNPAMKDHLATFDKVNKEMGKASMLYVADDDPGYDGEDGA